MCIELHENRPLFLSDFNVTNSHDRFLENSHIQNFMKIRPGGAELFHADGQIIRAKGAFVISPTRLQIHALHYRKHTSCILQRQKVIYGNNSSLFWQSSDSAKKKKLKSKYRIVTSSVCAPFARPSKLSHTCTECKILSFVSSCVMALRTSTSAAIRTLVLSVCLSVRLCGMQSDCF